MEKLNKIKEVFKIFQSKESYFIDTSNEQSNELIVSQILVICGFTFLYGVVMGSYYSFLQSIIAGLKVVFLFLSTLMICFPCFFIIQQVLGSKMKVRQMLIIVLSGFVLTSTISLSFAPIIIFFQITGGNYHFLQLLHVAVFVFAGIFGMKLMVNALKIACEVKNIYPQIGVTVFKIWIIILVFVGIQLSWSLRPFLCNKNEEFKLFRKYEGNFYTAVMYSFEQLIKGNDSPGNKTQKTNIYKKRPAIEIAKDTTNNDDN